MSNLYPFKRDKNPAMPVFRRHFKITDRIRLGVGTSNPIACRCIESTEDGHLLQHIDQPEITEVFTHAQIAVLENSEGWRLDRDWFDPKRAKTRMTAGLDRLVEVDLDEFPDVWWKTQICIDFLAEEAAERTTRSDDSMRVALAAIVQRINQKLLANAGRTDKKVEIRPTPNPKTVRGWLSRFETSGHDPLSLRDHYHVCGSLTPTLDADSEARVHKHALTYADDKRPSKRRCWENMRDEIVGINEVRIANGEQPLLIPSRKTMDRAVDDLNQYDVDAARFGLERARQKYNIVSGGLTVIRPGERIEIDEWKISLQSLFIRSGQWWKLNPHHREAIKGKRWWLSVAKDVASQCYLAMRLGPTPTSDMASATLRMAVSDKSHYAEFAGCQSPWNQRCGFEQVGTDMGGAYISDLFRQGVIRLNGTVLTPPAGWPQFRATIERSFGTIRTRALSLYSGQTGANVLDKGDEDPAKFASVPIETLAWNLVRFAVDCEHNRPSPWLFGETPARAWRRLTALYGTVPPPDRDTIRNAFGVQLTRNLDQRGVRFANMYFQSLALQEYRRQNGDCYVEIIVDTEDLGWISVKVGERQWLSVKCLHPGFDGFTLAEWIEVQTALRRRFAAEAAIDEHIVRRAMADLRASSADAFRRANIGQITLKPEQIQHHERTLLIAWRPPEDPNYAGLYDVPDIFAGLRAAPHAAAPDTPPTDQPPTDQPPSATRKWSLD